MKTSETTNLLLGVIACCIFPPLIIGFMGLEILKCFDEQEKKKKRLTVKKYRL
jgi:hypothetical protein